MEGIYRQEVGQGIYYQKKRQDCFSMDSFFWEGYGGGNGPAIFFFLNHAYYLTSAVQEISILTVKRLHYWDRLN